MHPLAFAHILTTVFLILAILLQAGESGMFSAGGLMTGGEHFHTRRGLEKVLFYSTFFLMALFVVLSILLVR